MNNAVLLTSNAVPITACFAGLIILLITLAAINTTRVRIATAGKWGESEARERIRRASRAHGNTLEHGLPVILLMLLYELLGGNAVLLCSIGSAFLGIRLLYIAGMLTKPGGGAMQVAAGLTYLVELGLIAVLLLHVF